MNKKINTNTNTNNNIYNNNNKNYIINHNLQKYSQKKNNDNISLLEKIKYKVYKEKNESQKKSINIKEKENSKNYTINIPKKKNKIEENIIQFNDSREDNFDREIDENAIKKESNDEEDDILSEEVDEMEEGGNNVINSINKINSINVHSNFIKSHYYTGSGFSMNSNNSNSNNSSLQQKCYTEPDEFSIYPQNFLNAPSSGRSNYSGGTNMAHPPSQNINDGRPGLYAGFGYQIKNSFLSTNANSHNQSGHKIDTSLSNESGQSPHYLGKFGGLQYNNSMTNIAKNNTFMFPFTSSVTPIINKHIYTSSFNSNENLFKQPFSLNTKTFTNNFNYSKKEKQIIKLEDVALGKETRTTVMIRNIPIKYNDKVLETELEQFEGKYDCLYMPFDYEKKGNKGYAFINFVDPLHILYFHEKFYGKKWQLFESSKICELNSANFQGIYEIQKHSKNYKGYKKPLFYSEYNENMIIPSKYLLKLKIRFPNLKYHENKEKKIIIVDSFE